MSFVLILTLFSCVHWSITCQSAQVQTRQISDADRTFSLQNVESESESNDDDELHDADNVHKSEEEQVTDVGALTKSKEEEEADINGAFTDSEKEKEDVTDGAFTSIDRDNEEDGYAHKENITGIDQRFTDFPLLYDLLKASGVEKAKASVSKG